MPAPLGKTPTRKMPRITVFGIEDQPATRNAVRFFRERRIVVTYVDVGRKPLTAAEIRAFLERLGAATLLDTGSRAFLESGLASPAAGSGDLPGIVGRILGDPRLLRLPLVRFGDKATAGKAETAWKGWLARPT